MERDGRAAASAEVPFAQRLTLALRAREPGVDEAAQAQDRRRDHRGQDRGAERGHDLAAEVADGRVGREAHEEGRRRRDQRSDKGERGGEERAAHQEPRGGEATEDAHHAEHERADAARRAGEEIVEITEIEREDERQVRRDHLEGHGAPQRPEDHGEEEVGDDLREDPHRHLPGTRPNAGSGRRLPGTDDDGSGGGGGERITSTPPRWPKSTDGPTSTSWYMPYSFFSILRIVPTGRSRGKTPPRPLVTTTSPSRTSSLRRRYSIRLE